MSNLAVWDESNLPTQAMSIHVGPMKEEPFALGHLLDGQADAILLVQSHPLH